MNIEIEKIIALLYQYFLSRRRVFPFLSTIFMLGFVILAHLGIIIEAFQLFKNYHSFSIGSFSIDANKLIFISGTFILLGLSVIIKKKNLLKYNFTDEELTSGYRNIMIYILGLILISILINYLK